MAFKEIEQARLEIMRISEEIPRSHGSGPRWEENKDKPVSIGDCCRTASISFEGGLSLYNAIRHSEPTRVIELGTCLGISGFYITLALEQNNKGYLDSIESQPRRCEIAREYAAKLGYTRMKVFEGLFEDWLTPLLETDEYQFAFIDGSHTYDKTLEYFMFLKDHRNFSGTICFDDCERRGVKEALQYIIKNKLVKKYAQKAARLLYVEV